MADCFNIYLPSECVSVHSWKVKAGSSVRTGELIAIGLRTTKTDLGASKEQSSLTPSSTTTKANPARKPNIAAKVSSDNIGSTTVVKSRSSARSRMLARANAEKAAKAASSTAIDPSNRTEIVSPSNGFLRILGGDSNKSKKGRNIIAVVEPCTHPTILGSLCAVCGLSVDEIDNVEGRNGGRPSVVAYCPPVPTENRCEPTRQSSSTSSSRGTDKVTVGGVTIDISPSEARNLGLADQNRLRGSNKLSLVLDLDHTLVHATADPRGVEEVRKRDGDVRTILLPVEVVPTMEANSGGGRVKRTVTMRHFIKTRPFLKEFLLSVQDTYEITIYTAGTRGYAERVANVITRHIMEIGRAHV